jgi:hypothetical protein
MEKSRMIKTELKWKRLAFSTAPLSLDFIVPGTNGGSLRNKPCYFAFIQSFLPKLPKLLISTVLGVYSGKRDSVKLKQSLLPTWGISFQKTLKEPPFVPDTFN